MNEKRDCKIVQDLLPNYIEKLTNNETNKYIDEHLKVCDNCKNMLENMKKDLDVNTKKENKKAVKYFKKYKNKLRILRIILLIILIIFVINTARKMAIILDLSDKADTSINSNNYHRITYSYNQDSTGIAEVFCLEDKMKLVVTKISKEGINVTTMYADKIEEDEWGNERYNTNIYTVTDNTKTVKLNVNMGITADPQNALKTESLLDLLRISTFASIKNTTYNGEKCYYISNIYTFAFGSSAMYVNKETGLVVSTMGCEIEYSDGTLGRWPATDFVTEFNKVTEADFIEPDISEYKIEE